MSPKYVVGNKPIKSPAGWDWALRFSSRVPISPLDMNADWVELQCVAMGKVSRPRDEFGDLSVRATIDPKTSAIVVLGRGKQVSRWELWRLTRAIDKFLARYDQPRRAV